MNSQGQSVFDILKEDGLATLRKRQKEAKGGQGVRTTEVGAEPVQRDTEEGSMEGVTTDALPTLGKALEAVPGRNPQVPSVTGLPVPSGQPQKETEVPSRRRALRRLVGLE